MRCRRHPCWGGPGACSTCLRERLLALAAGQESTDDRSKSDICLSPLPRIPRSFSPYQPCRRSSACEDHLRNHRHRNHPRFYGMPQAVSSACRGNKGDHFSFFSSIFRSSNSGSPSSSSWISSFLPGRRKKKSLLFSLDEEAPGAICGKTYRTVARGMSPVSDGTGMEEAESRSPVGVSSEKSTETSTRLRRRAVHQRRAGAGRPSVSSYRFYLSPLVQIDPGSNRPDAGSGEARGHQCSTAAVFGANRSRKLADFGRYT